MTKDRTRKQAIRARMAVSGEPYSVAARQLAGFEVGGDALAAKVAARARVTVAEPGARMWIRQVIGLPWVETAETSPERRRGGFQGLARRLAGAVLHAGTHPVGEGFAEPVARRYMISAGTLGGFICQGDMVDQGRHGWRVKPQFQRANDYPVVMHWLWALWALSGTVAARPVGTGTVRGVYCQQLIAEVDLDLAAEAGGPGWPSSFRPGPEGPVKGELAVWIDEEHVRRVNFSQSLDQEAVRFGSADQATSVEVELWDFGISVAHLDWARFP